MISPFAMIIDANFTNCIYKPLIRTAKNVTWDIKCDISCKSKNVVYFLSCNLCHRKVTYIGQTTNFRLHMNSHISELLSGVSLCTFPRHVFQCGNGHNNLKEPFFKVFAFMSLSSLKLSTTSKEKLSKAGHATPGGGTSL